MTYWLYLDDIREPPALSAGDKYIVLRSSQEAISYVKQHGIPEYMSLDHDLGGDDTTMVFLRWLSDEYYDEQIPTYVVHSSNPVGKQNIISIMSSWKKSKGII